MTKIKIANWNIGSLYSNLDENLPYFTKTVSEARADIFCMQEFPIRDEIKELVMRCGGFSHLIVNETSESHVCKENRMGIAIFSKFPLTQVNKIELPKPGVKAMRGEIEEKWHSKFFTINLCRSLGGELVFITGHGFPFHRYDLEKPEFHSVITESFSVLDEWVSDYIKDNENARVYLPADFNITTPLDFMPMLRTRYYDTFHGVPTRPIGRKTDSVLLPNGVKCIEKENFIIRFPNGEPVFDHNFISVTIEC